MLLLLFIINGQSHAQEFSDSTSFSLKSAQNNALNFGLDKQLNTYYFTNYLKYGFITGNFFLNAREIFNSTIVNASQKSIKDEHNLFISGGYKVAPWLNAGLSLTNVSFSDDRYTQINKTALVNSIFYLQAIPMQNISFTPYAGLSSNQQINQTDNGFIYGADAAINSLMLSDFELNSQMKYQNEDISPRKNTLRNAGINLTNNLEDSFINTISAAFIEQRKDFYFTADAATALEYNITNNIQSRTETSYLIQDRIRSVPVLYGFTFDLLGSIYWRTIDRNTRYVSLSKTSSSNYDTQVNELKTDVTGGLDYKSKNLLSSFKFSYSQYEEKHEAKRIDGIDAVIYSDQESLEYLKNNQAETASLSLITNWLISEKDNIIFSIYHRKLKYDTPSSENFDDRDELLTIGRIGYERKLSQAFRMNLNLEGSMNKIVYIFSERSSNNNVRRFLKLSSSGYYSDNNFVSFNSAEVSANYTTFNYEYLNSSLRSYSFRQFMFKDSSAYKINNKIKFVFNGYVKLSEQGNFNWASFSELPSRFLDEKLIEPRIGYFAENLTLSWGIRYFNLSIYNVNTLDEKIKASEYQSIGPISEIKYKVGSKIDLTFFGWYEFVSGDNSKREIPNVVFKLNWFI